MSEVVNTVFLPGLLNTGELWKAQIQGLGSKIVPFVADLTHHNSLEDMAKNVLAKAPPKFALAGLSMGGYLAFEIYRQAPERVLKLCLCNTSARPDTPEATLRRQSLIALSKSGKFKGITARLLPQLIDVTHLENAELVKIIYDMADHVGREAFANQQTAIMKRVDSRPLLPQIHVQTQVISGRGDKITPVEVMREIARAIPNAHFAIIENCGHLSPLEQPETVTRLMRRWLER